MRTAWISLGAFLLAACAGAGSGPGGGGDDTSGDDDVTSGGDGGPDNGPVTLIDDLDDGDDSIREVGGRAGVWYTYNDGTAGGMQTPAATGDFKPAAGGPSGKGFAAITTGKGFTDWGAGMGFDLNAPGEGKKGTLDASAYQGMRFKAKGNAPLRFSIVTKAVTPMADGGDCAPSAVEGKMCEDGHGKTITLTSSWKDVEVKWTELKQEGWGAPVAFDAKQLIGVQFSIPKSVMFDLEIDDVSFF